MNTALQHIRSLTPFKQLREETIKHLAEKLKACSFKKGENLIVPGQIMNEMYFVEDGAQMSYFENEQKLHVMAFTYPPEICVLPGSFSCQVPSRYTITCVTDSRFYSLSYLELNRLFDAYPELERLFRRMTEIVLAGLVERHLELKTSTVKQRFQNFCLRSGFLLHLVPHKYLASYLNIDPTNFSKLYNQVKI